MRDPQEDSLILLVGNGRLFGDIPFRVFLQRTFLTLVVEKIRVPGLSSLFSDLHEDTDNLTLLVEKLDCHCYLASRAALMEPPDTAGWDTSLPWLPLVSNATKRHIVQVHPPGGATALIAVTSPPAVRLKGFYIVMPVLSGSLILLLVALIVNNFRRHVSTPTKS